MTPPRSDAWLDVEVVVPTVGRPSLGALVRALRADPVPPRRIVVVDDRADGDGHLDLDLEAASPELVVVTSGGRGPAAARNVGWRATSAPWVAFLDDDVVPPGDWGARLAADLDRLAMDVAGSQGRVRVPLPTDRAPTDWERNVAGLEEARWATADLAYRRDVLVAVGGFDERFPRAYREDADLGLRVTAAGWRIVRGEREIVHPVRPADDIVSVRLQAGNADDPFLRAVHGPRWRERAGIPAGRRPWHLATTAAGATAVGAAAAGRGRLAGLAATAWAGLTADFAWRRIAPGPRSRAEIRRMTLTSLVLPLAASAHWLRGVVTLPGRLRRPGPVPGVPAHAPRSPVARPSAPRASTPRHPARPSSAPRSPAPAAAPLPAAVLFDRDGTLVHDVPYNGDPDAVAPVASARAALDRLRRRGIPVGVVSNQSGIARGLLTEQQVRAVNARIDALLGPFDHWGWCPHGPDDGCACRKPAPGLIEAAAAALGVDPRACVVVGDIGSDVEAALAVGARPILVPTPVTRPAEVAAAPAVAADLAAAVDLALSGGDGGARTTSRVGAA